MKKQVRFREKEEITSYYRGLVQVYGQFSDIYDNGENMCSMNQICEKLVVIGQPIIWINKCKKPLSDSIILKNLLQQKFS